MPTRAQKERYVQAYKLLLEAKQEVMDEVVLNQETIVQMVTTQEVIWMVSVVTSQQKVEMMKRFDRNKIIHQQPLVVLIQNIT